MAANLVIEELQFPHLPVQHDRFVQYVAQNSETQMCDLLEPYKQYDAQLRKAFAQQPDHPALNMPNIFPVFDGHEKDIKIRARDLGTESVETKESYIMPLRRSDRKQNGSLAIVDSLSRFREQFSLFSESALSDLDWSNVVAAGSSVVTPLLPVPAKHAASKRALRHYYHEIFAPASDVDLFLYGLTEDEAVEKIKQIERNIKDALLCETTTIRTKNAITIASQYPTRHIQIVLRLYKSVSEILTGFDVDCSCAAYDGKQVWSNPRALAAFMTQVNTIDLTRRSPSYESRLAKYHKRGFEIYWPDLDRSRVDPTIFERSFMRTEGLARLLVLEKLPTDADRERYNDQRREERGRPSINRYRRHRRKLIGDIKADHDDEVAEWDDGEDVISSYHTFTIPYGPKYHAARIEKLLFTKDLLLNAEWNKSKDREVHLHRHPAFFGDVDNILGDCCGSCPQPSTMEEEEVYEKESKVYVSGNLSFIRDDAGRQTIGSFNPLSPDDYTSMAYVGNTVMFCHAIVDGDAEYVQSWLEREGNDPNTRDHTGRTPLILAVMQSPLEIVQLLIDHGARLVARLVDGKTALHIAAMRGDVSIIKALLLKSSANEEEEESKLDAKRAAHQAKKLATQQGQEQDGTLSEDSDIEMIGEDEGRTDIDATTEASIVNIKSLSLESTDRALDDTNEDEPDIYDINVVAWDTAVSPLHLAIVKGHLEVVRCLVEEFGADLLLPVKLMQEDDSRSAKASLLTLVLALQLPLEKAEQMTRLLFELGATSSQADVQHRTAFQACSLQAPELLDTYIEADETGVKRAMNHLASWGYMYSPTVRNALYSAIDAWDSLTALKLLTLGAKASINYATYDKIALLRHERRGFGEDDYWKKNFERDFQQPIILAVEHELPEVAIAMVRERDADVNTITKDGHNVLQNEHQRLYLKGTTLLDVVLEKLKDLREWTPHTEADEPPELLKEDAFYLESYAIGSYARWVAQDQLKEARRLTQERWDEHVESARRLRSRRGLEEKQAAVFDMINKFRELEALLRKRQAKTFKELHPDIAEPTQTRNDFHYSNQQGSTRYEFKGINFHFSGPNMTDDLRAEYLKLFEACWRGDIEAAKQHLLTPWTDAEGQLQTSLQVAISDAHVLSPFSIAVLRGHLDLARVLIDIAADQHARHIEKSKQQRTRLRGQGDCDYSDSDDGSEVQLETETIDDEFTHEDVGVVATLATSNVTASTLLGWTTYRADEVGPQRTQAQASNKRTNTGSIKDLKYMIPDAADDKSDSPKNLIQFAVWKQDQELLEWLLELNHEFYDIHKETEDDHTTSFTVNNTDFQYALKADHPSIVGVLLRLTGAGLPLQQFVKKSGAEIEEKAATRYYQGLSVRGSKKKEWALRGHNDYHQPTSGHEDKHPPLLECARLAALENVEWFLSDAPLRAYQEFASRMSDDKRFIHLAKTKGGLSAMVKQFLGKNNQLALHCALLAEPDTGSLETIKYLVQAMPESINLKSKDGLTPLAIAFLLYREDAAKILIAAGADQTVRNRDGQNLVHLLLHGNWHADDQSKREPMLKRMLSLIDGRLLKSMFLERTTASDGTKTPLAQYLAKHTTSEDDVGVCKLLLEKSGTADLELIDGKGNTPIHTALAHGNFDTLKLLVEQRPELIHREGAVGRTPFEVVEDEILKNNFSIGHGWDHVEDCDFAAKREYTASFNERNKSIITARDSEQFVKKWSSSKTLLERKWELMQTTKAQLEEKGISKRILVSLNEANEVARRLASRQQYEESHDDDNGQDEVHLWVGNASISTKTTE